MIVKLFAFDLDNTVVDHQNNISPTVSQWICRAMHHTTLCICSGRSRDDMALFSSKMGISQAIYVCEGGAQIIDPHDRQISYLCLLPDQVDEIGALERTRPIYYCSDGKDYLNQVPNRHKVSRITFLDLDQKDCLSIKSSLKHLQNVDLFSYTFRGSLGIDIYKKGVSKGEALKTVSQKYQIAKEEILFVGDGLNDLSAFHQAGFCVAMGNAVPELKKAADYVCPTIDEDGIVSVIKKFILPKEEQ